MLSIPTSVAAALCGRKQCGSLYSLILAVELHAPTADLGGVGHPLQFTVSFETPESDGTKEVFDLGFLLFSLSSFFWTVTAGCGDHFSKHDENAVLEPFWWAFCPLAL